MELTVLSKEQIRETIAKRAAREFKDGDVVTLGIGIPTEAANYISNGVHIMFQAEIGLLGSGKNLSGDEADKRITNAGGAYVDVIKGACFYDSQTAFMMMRGGHIDATVLGALQVDEEGSLASWMIPGKFVPGIGGSMDLVIGTKKVIVAMEHTSKDEIKIVKKCTLPLTAYREVSLIITEKCVFEVTRDGARAGLVMTEINPLFSIDEVKATTGASFAISPNLKNME